MDENRIFWLKLPVTFFADKRIKLLIKQNNGHSLCISYIKMLLHSSGTGGKLFYDGILGDISQEIALAIDEEPETVTSCIDCLNRLKLAESMPEEITLLELPQMIGSECMSAERVRKHRTRQNDTDFTPPTIADVELSCKENRFQIDAGRFVSYYASRGWKCGNATMTDWRAAVQSWEARENKKSPENELTDEQKQIYGLT